MPENYSFKHKPYGHQIEALKRSWNKKYFAYFMEMGCVDSNTEYLSKHHGWKPINLFDPNDPDEIAVSTSDGTIKYEYPTNYIVKETNELVHFKSLSGHIDMFVTPNHNCPIMMYNRDGVGTQLDLSATELLEHANRNVQGMRFNVGIPTTVNNNIFLLNKGSIATIEELTNLLDIQFVTEYHLPEYCFEALQCVNNYQRTILLENAKKFNCRLAYRDVSGSIRNKEDKHSEFYYCKNMRYARLIHYYIVGAGGQADIIQRKNYIVVIRRFSKDTSSIYNRRFGRARVPSIYGRGDNSPPLLAYCFRTSTGYVLLRRGQHIFVTGNSGKTKVAIDNAAMLYDKGAIDSMVVIAPKGCYANWSSKEIPQHLPDHINRNVWLWSASMTAKQRKDFIDSIKPSDTALNVLVINVESLAVSGDADTVIKKFLKVNSKTMGIVDESTCIKSPSSKRTRKVLSLAGKFHVRRILTGSPITNSPFDIYPQTQFLQKGVLGFNGYPRFREYYAVYKPVNLSNGRRINIVDHYINLDDLAKRLEGISYRVLKDDCLDLPEKIYQTRNVELTADQIRLYKEMFNDKFAELEGREMSAGIVLTMSLRLHQILCGCYHADDGTILRVPNHRVRMLMDILQETTGKSIIFANYRDNISEIAERIADEYGPESLVTYFGDTTTEQRVAAVEAFEDPKSPVRFFVANPSTAGRGLTLVQAQTVIYYSNNYSLEVRQQSEDRAHRPGQVNKVCYIDLIAGGTMDEKIVNALLMKRDIAAEIMQDSIKDWFKL